MPLTGKGRRSAGTACRECGVWSASWPQPRPAAARCAIVRVSAGQSVQSDGRWSGSLYRMTTAEAAVAIDRWTARLIVLLARQPRIGVLECPRRLGVARGTVQARLDRLQSNGVIRGFGPEVDPAALGYPVTAFATLEIRQGSGHRRARRTWPPIPEVLELHTITGQRRHALPPRGPVQRRPPAGDRPGGGRRGHPPRVHAHRAVRARALPGAPAWSGTPPASAEDVDRRLRRSPTR